MEGHKPDDLLRMLDEYRIEATLLTPDSAPALLLDLTQGWQKLYADDIAVVHIRTTPVAETRRPPLVSPGPSKDGLPDR
jgi:hypothetical protein